MIRRFTPKKVQDLFKVKSGDFHATKELDEGAVPLISCGESDNGCVGYFDIPGDKIYRRAITIAYNGQPLTVKFHPYSFGAKDDVAVLLPHKPLQDTTLLFVAALIDRNKWRYNYGRKCFREKLSGFTLLLPMTADDQIDENLIAEIFSEQYRDFVPEKGGEGISEVPNFSWRNFSITEIFKPRRGDFHSISDLAPGSYMTISRVSTDNGVVGYFERPDGAVVYPQGSLTISTVGGDTFVQLGDFIATDNVIVCIPKEPLRITTLFFIAFVLNRQKWRYSYGRQCYMNKVSKINFDLPITHDGKINEDEVANLVQQATFWNKIKTVFQ